MVHKDDDITPATLLQHMQGMETRILTVLRSELSDVQSELKTEIQEVKADVRRVEQKVDLALVQIGNLDARLDDIEVKELPKLKKVVGMRR
jgi:hypothetical protein